MGGGVDCETGVGSWYGGLVSEAGAVVWGGG